jgi:hypothetical protein
MSLIGRRTSLLGASPLALASERWRDAARVVWTRWDVFLGAEPQMRAFAFESYTAALDAEETAAAAMARLLPSNAA